MEHEQAFERAVLDTLQEILQVSRGILHADQDILATSLAVLDTNQAILHQLKHPIINAFEIEEITMQAIAPGFNPVYSASPIPAGATLNPTQPVPTWTSSDTTNAPVLADATGLNATVSIPASATVGASFTLTISYTNLDGSVATGTLSQTIVAPPPVDVTGFLIQQTA